VRYAEVAIDALHLDASRKIGSSTSRSSIVNRGANTLQAHGNYQLPLEFCRSCEGPD
jgi:hypothetical protein